MLGGGIQITILKKREDKYISRKKSVLLHHRPLILLTCVYTQTLNYSTNRTKCKLTLRLLEYNAGIYKTFQSDTISSPVTYLGAVQIVFLVRVISQHEQRPTLVVKFFLDRHREE